MRKRSFLLAAGVCLAALSLTMGSAFADPVPAGPRTLAGVGSDTTQDVMNAFANGDPTTCTIPEPVNTVPYPGIGINPVNCTGTKTVASYNATGTATITTKASPPACTFPRPGGSGSGINALHADDLAGTNCIQFARSSNNDSASRTGQNLTYIPFAMDTETYASRSVSTVPANLTRQQLMDFYDCAVTNPNVSPVLPHFGSGSRTFWLHSLGLLDGTSPPCVRDTPGLSTGTPPGVEENDGRELKNAAELVPYSVAQWTSQTTGVVGDRHGYSILRAINGKNPFKPGFPVLFTRNVYNVIRTGDVPNAASTAPIATTFVDQRGLTPPGPNAAICLNSDLISRYRFMPIPDCGSTAIRTN